MRGKRCFEETVSGGEREAPPKTVLVFQAHEEVSKKSNPSLRQIWWDILWSSLKYVSEIDEDDHQLIRRILNNTYEDRDTGVSLSVEDKKVIGLVLDMEKNVTYSKPPGSQPDVADLDSTDKRDLVEDMRIELPDLVAQYLTEH